MFRIIAFFMIMLFVRLYVRIGILLACGNHLHDSIILLRREAWTHKTSLSSPLFFGVPVPRKGSEWSCICVLMVYFASFYNVSIGIRKCSDSVVFFAFHSIICTEPDKIYCLYLCTLPSNYYLIFTCDLALQ
jgi:hypothetical protein